MSKTMPRAITPSVIHAAMARRDVVATAREGALPPREMLSYAKRHTRWLILHAGCR